MKSLLLLVLPIGLFQLTSHAQKRLKDSDYLNYFRHKWHFQQGTSVNLSNKSIVIGAAERDSFGRLLPNIHFLSQDGMPCLSPNTKEIAKIPNAYKGREQVPYISQAPRLPNPYTLKSHKAK